LSQSITTNSDRKSCVEIIGPANPAEVAAPCKYITARNAAMREMIRIRISLPLVTLATAWNMARIDMNAKALGAPDDAAIRIARG
jgi:hypothetical protein